MTRQTALRCLKGMFCGVLFFYLAGCSPTAPGTPSLVTGTLRQLVQQSVGVAGGTIVVNLPGDSLNGLTITVPDSALTFDQTITVSAIPIKSNPFGAHFHPVSPLIRVGGIDGYTNNVILITIPIRKNPGDFAMGFLYNEATKKLEGMPVINLTDTNITVGTCILSGTNGLSKRGAGASANSISDLIISSFTQTLLNGTGILSTSFTPGVDDWEFVNHGSYIAPSGNCAGQSITSMWYWYEVKLPGNGPPLYHAYDRFKNNNALWEDNPRGYRFANVVQADLDFNGWVRNALIFVRNSLPLWSFNAFAAAMLVTGEPQYAGINCLQPPAGHALVAYKMDYVHGTIWVADPNFPGNSSRTFSFVGSAFLPYHSALNADDQGIDFTQIGYFAKTAFINWNDISARYTQFKDSTIGTVQPNVFPHAIVWRTDGDSGALSDSAMVDQDSILVQNRCADCGSFLIAGGNAGAQYMTVFNAQGSGIDSMPPVKPQAAITLRLIPGINTFGFYLIGGQQTGTDPLGNAIFKDKFVDFVWRNILFKKLDISPKNPTGVLPNSLFKLTALTYGVRPKKWHMVWSIQDTGGVRDTIVYSPDSSVKKSWPVAGQYNVKCSLIDEVSDSLFSSDSTVVQVGENLLARLQKCVRIKIVLNGANSGGTTCALTLNDGMPLTDMVFTNWNGVQGVNGAITWNQNTFSLSYTVSSNIMDSSVTTGTFTGTIAASGTSIDTMTATSHTLDIYTMYGLVQTTDQSICLRHIPLNDLYTTQITMGSQADTVAAQPLVGSVTYRSVSTIDGAPNSDESLATINWNDPQLYLSVYFTDK